MATSGTVGETTITTDKLLDHAYRRCGLAASLQTPETVEASKESLFMLLVHLANRGLNLWCVEKTNIPLVTGKAKYDLPAGTLSVLNVMHSRPNTLSGSEVSTATSQTLTLDDEATLTKFSITLASLPTAPVLVEYSDDGVTWSTVTTLALVDLALGANWFDIDPGVVATDLRASVSSGSLSCTLTATDSVRDLVLARISRDQYSSQPNKETQGEVPTDYFYEKNLNPSLTLWPVPNSSTSFLSAWLHRQVQDVGSLSQELAIPTRWLESITTQLAFRVALESPGIPPDRLMLLKGLADEAVITAELDETDMAPIMMAPRIGVYTR